jgi:hypothetical protein
VWGIPLARVAGVLAVSYTGAGTRDASAHEGPPSVQRPEPRPPVLPAEEPRAEPTTEEPVTPEPEPEPEPTLADPAPPVEDPLVADPGPLAPADSAVDTSLPATDDEVAPIAQPEESARRARAKALLRPTENRRFFSMGVGGASATNPYAAYYGGAGGLDFQWEMAIGSHGRRRPEFGGAFVVQQRKGFLNELSFVGRFQWDKPFSDAFALYSSLNVDLGVNLPIGYAGYLAFGEFPPSAMIGLGWGIKGILAERFLMWLRPVNPNLVAPAFASFPPVAVRWDVTAGVGVVW